MAAQVSLLRQTDRRRLRYAEMIACGELVASQQREVVAAVVMAGGDLTREQALLTEIERTLTTLVAWHENALAKLDADFP